MSATFEEVLIPAPELRGGSFTLGACRDIEVCLDGPAGTGKTFGALFKIHLAMSMYPGAKGLIARKWNTALAGSALATYREMIDPRENISYFGGSKAEPPGYRYPNGSFIAVSGLDKREKIKSWEFDIAYINEATECEVDDVEFARSRLRHGYLGYHQLIMDVNPDAPHHWLNKRMEAGITRRLISRHEDNPKYHDGHDWTPAGREYIFGILEGLTGVRKARLRYGIWAAAEGTVYEEAYDRARNVISPFAIPRSWPRYMVVDFGYTNPFVCKWYAVDPDGRLYCYRELYQTRTLVEDHAVTIALAAKWWHLLPRRHPQFRGTMPEHADPLPRAIICDHDAEDRATLERKLGLLTVPAKKTVRDGIQAVSARLRPAGDGKPRLYYFADMLLSRDPDLDRLKKPASTIEEFDSYVWDLRAGAKHGEEPLKENDHGMDCDRYMCAHLDLQESDVSYYKAIWR